MSKKFSTVKLVSCPTCGKQVEWTEQNTWRPFCSERCQIIDLGDWASEKHTIPSDTADDFIKPEDDDNY